MLNYLISFGKTMCTIFLMQVNLKDIYLCSLFYKKGG